MNATDAAAPPVLLRAPLRRRLRAGLFGSAFNTVVTILTIALIAWVLPPLLRWTLLDATWSGTSADCAAREGACWAFVGAKLRFFLFALYPAERQWRPALVLAALFAMLALSAMPRFWRRGLLLAWPAVILLSWLVMAGWGGSAVSTNRWGGLPVTFLVWIVCFGVSLPLGVLLALARRSRMTGLRALAVGTIELLRGLPMVAILYVAMLILPMALPEDLSVDKLLRAMIMIALFWSAYTAEAVRGGLQAIPPGQAEAASALGLGYWRVMRLVVLPQAFRIIIPALVNLAIGFLLATSLLTVIGIFDLLNAAKASATDPSWLGFYDEAYLVVALVYFAFGLGGSRYSQWLEHRLKAPRRP